MSKNPIYDYEKDERNLTGALIMAIVNGVENWETIDVSEKKDKRFKILSPSKKIIHFGLYPFNDGTFLDHRNEHKKQVWRARMKNILLDNGERAFKNEESPLFYAWNILW